MKTVLEAIAAGRVAPVYLVHGDRVLAEPAAARLAAALGLSFGCEPVVVRRPDELADVVADLRTFSLFSDGKVVVVVESGVLADRASAASLFDEVRGQLPWSGGALDLSGKPREAALRLLQILRLFDITPTATNVDKALSALPPAVFAGKSGRAGRKESADDTRAALRPLLEAAIAVGLRGLGETEASLVADLLRDGLPDRHALVLVESAVADGHPLLAALERRVAIIAAGEVTVEKGKFGGLASLAAELERETRVGIDRPALEALARRTLRAEDRRRGGEEGAVEADSTARFAAEYRKLATLLESGGGTSIGLDLVHRNVEDRGDEDVWQILDAIGAGRSAEALSRLARRFGGAEDPVLERLSFFALFASFCRQVVAIRGIAIAGSVSLKERDYGRFKGAAAKQLVDPVEGLAANPLKGIHEYRLFKAYQAAARLPAATIDRLPALVLEAERRLKGESGEPDAALAELVLAVAKPA